MPARKRPEFEQQNSNYQQIRDNHNYELPVRGEIVQFFKDTLLMPVYLCFFIPICLIVFSSLTFTSTLILIYPPSIRMFKIIVDCVSLFCDIGVLGAGIWQHFMWTVIILFPFSFTILNLVLIIRSIISFLTIVLLFISGLYLNAEFYSPTVAPAMILVVYCWRCWRAFVETKYLQLKTKIYEVSEERANENSLHTEIEDDTSMLS